MTGTWSPSSSDLMEQSRQCLLNATLTSHPLLRSPSRTSTALGMKTQMFKTGPLPGSSRGLFSLWNPCPRAAHAGSSHAGSALPALAGLVPGSLLLVLRRSFLGGCPALPRRQPTFPDNSRLFWGSPVWCLSHLQARSPSGRGAPSALPHFVPAHGTAHSPLNG